MDTIQLANRLNLLGIELSIYTLRRWSKQEIISPYEIRIEKKQKRRPGRPPNKAEERTRCEKKCRPAGRRSEWPDKALEEAAAVWAVRAFAKQLADCGIKTSLSLEKIREIKEIAGRVFTSPEVIHELPHDFVLKTPNPSHIYSFQDLETKIVKDDYPLNELMITWIAARAKAQKGVEIAPPKKVIIRWRSQLMRSKNPLLKDVQADEFEHTLSKEGLLMDTPLDMRDLRRIPVRFRNVPDWLLRQECRIPPSSPALKSFWNRVPESATYEEIDHLINEITKEWRYIPTDWKLKFSGVELEKSSSGHDDLVVFLDDHDSRQKALYAPFSEYNPYHVYDPEHAGRLYEFGDRLNQHDFDDFLREVNDVRLRKF